MRAMMKTRTHTRLPLMIVPLLAAVVLLVSSVGTPVAQMAPVASPATQPNYHHYYDKHHVLPGGGNCNVAYWMDEGASGWYSYNGDADYRVHLFAWVTQVGNYYCGDLESAIEVNCTGRDGCVASWWTQISGVPASYTSGDTPTYGPFDEFYYSNVVANSCTDLTAKGQVPIGYDPILTFTGPKC